MVRALRNIIKYNFYYFYYQLLIIISITVVVIQLSELVRPISTLAIRPAQLLGLVLLMQSCNALVFLQGVLLRLRRFSVNSDGTDAASIGVRGG